MRTVTCSICKKQVPVAGSVCRFDIEKSSCIILCPACEKTSVRKNNGKDLSGNRN